MKLLSFRLTHFELQNLFVRNVNVRVMNNVKILLPLVVDFYKSERNMGQTCKHNIKYINF